MCLAVPAKVVELNGATATVDIGGNRREANISLLENVAVGEFVMLHAGFAIAKYDSAEAERTLALLREMFLESP